MIGFSCGSSVLLNVIAISLPVKIECFGDVIHLNLWRNFSLMLKETPKKVLIWDYCCSTLWKCHKKVLTL